MVLALIDILLSALRAAFMIWGAYQFFKNDKTEISTLWYGMFVIIMMASGNVILWRQVYD